MGSGVFVGFGISEPPLRSFTCSTQEAIMRSPGSTPARWAMERQIRLVAGLVVLISITASVLWPLARILAGAVGLGLTVAAVTDTCLLGRLLSKLPYNRMELGR